MSDGPPQLGEIPQQSEISVPTLKSTMETNGPSAGNGPQPDPNTSIQNAKDTIYNSEVRLRNFLFTMKKLIEPILDAQSTLTSIQNHPTTQNATDAITNGPFFLYPLYAHCSPHQGPVAETVKDQHAKTTSEFRNLANSRATPSQPAATGQPLTHYHSFFYNLLSWQNKRATALSYLSVVASIFAARYLPALSWGFKILYFALGGAAALEVAGRLVLSQGLATSLRPKKYYTIPREALEAALEDVEQLINFFVIEFQRILFVENLANTLAAFLAAFISYWLIKVVPLWGLSLISVSAVYLSPLIYINNKELIDQQLDNAYHIINSQALQVRDLAAHHTSRATSTAKAYAGDYTSKAQEYIGSARGRSKSPELIKSSPQIKSEPGSEPKYSPSDFPHAPKQDLVPGVTSHQEQYEKSEFGGQAEPSY